MNIAKITPAFVVCSIIGGAFPLSAAAKDCANACTADEVITSEVKTSFDQYPELAIPNAIQVQTHNQAVYLYGNVATGLQRNEAISLARRVPNVKRVISSISTGNSGG
jgi:osmotically-inducible protein OsmY